MNNVSILIVRNILKRFTIIDLHEVDQIMSELG